MKNLVIEAAYTTIKESLEWAIGDKDATFASFVDGVVAMTDMTLEKLREKKLISED